MLSQQPRANIALPPSVSSSPSALLTDAPRLETDENKILFLRAWGITPCFSTGVHQCIGRGRQNVLHRLVKSHRRFWTSRGGLTGCWKPEKMPQGSCFSLVYLKLTSRPLASSFCGLLVIALRLTSSWGSWATKNVWETAKTWTLKTQEWSSWVGVVRAQMPERGPLWMKVTVIFTDCWPKRGLK